MILNETLTVPTFFNTDTAPTMNDCENSIKNLDMPTYASKAKSYLSKALTEGWQIKLVTPIHYHDIIFLHYVLEKEDKDDN